MPVPFYTIAGRVLSYGRYGSGGQDVRLYPLYIGYPNLVRGYDVNTPDLGFNRLLGSRILVGNLEFRFPLLRPAGLSPRMYGPLPTELVFFADTGVAWNAGQKPSFLGGSREAVSSAGVAFRTNLFGAAIAEFDFSRPFQQSSQGWVFQFNFSPGF
jgi:outer membrane protein assembly factor BamA